MCVCVILVCIYVCFIKQPYTNTIYFIFFTLLSVTPAHNQWLSLCIFLLSYYGKRFVSCDCHRRTLLTVNCGDYCVFAARNYNFFTRWET